MSTLDDSFGSILDFLHRALAIDLPFSKNRIVEVYKLREKIKFEMDHINK